MTGAAPQDFKPFQMTFSVSSDGEAQELDAAWREIVSGKRARVNAAAQELDEVMERAMVGLEKIVDAIEANPGTTQTRRLVQFLAGLYNGNEYHVDLTDLRALDTELANACVDYLNYDRLAKVEVHSHLPGGGRQINQWIRDNGVRRRWRMSAWDDHALRLDALADRLDKRWDALVDEALGEFLTHHEGGGIRVHAGRGSTGRWRLSARACATTGVGGSGAPVWIFGWSLDASPIPFQERELS